VINDVCGACNGGFSKFDDALASNSLVGLQKVGSTPSSAFEVKLGGEVFFTDPVSGITFECALRNELAAQMYPQVHGSPATGTLLINSGGLDDFERLAAYLEKKIANGGLGSVHVKLGPENAGKTPRFVMHRENDGFFRGQTDADVAALRTMLESNWSQVAGPYRAQISGSSPPVQARGVHQPEMQVTLRIDFNEIYRAIAKIAFNVMTSMLGPTFALEAAFDPIREYIRGADVRLPPVTPGQVAVDGRFVSSAIPGATSPLSTNGHAVVLFGSPIGLRAWVTLYQTSNFIVHLADVAPEGLIPRAHEFSITRSGNKELELEEFFRRLAT